jgi:M6 family metalloprotease-like protein
MKIIKVEAGFVMLVCAVIMLTWGIGHSEENDLGLQSTQAIGEKRVLAVVVRFPDATPRVPIEMVKQRAHALNTYVVEQSYGLASVNVDFRGYITLPSSLGRYKVSQYNNQVDAGRVRKLVEDTMTILEKDVDFSSYDHMLIIPAVITMPGQGYGMICYCANPGMLTEIQKTYGFRSRGRETQYETLRSRGGKQFKGGVLVGAENANLGMFAHDYFHALGGIYDRGRRFAP